MPEAPRHSQPRSCSPEKLRYDVFRAVIRNAAYAPPTAPALPLAHRRSDNPNDEVRHCRHAEPPLAIRLTPLPERTHDDIIVAV